MSVLWIFRLYLPILFVSLIYPAPIPDSTTQTLAHSQYVDIIFRLLLSLVYVFPSCDLLSLSLSHAHDSRSHFVAFAAVYLASGQNAIYVLYQSVERLDFCLLFLVFSFLLCSTNVIATCHLRDLRLLLQPRV